MLLAMLLDNEPTIRYNRDMTTSADGTFRKYPTEMLPGPGGHLYAVTRCEELDPESGRWEPFCSVVKVEGLDPALVLP